MANPENIARSCPRCGAIVGPDAPDGLCSRCLIGLNFVTETEIPGEVLGPPGTQVVKPSPLPAPPPETLTPHFPQLEILEVLGRGGMGVVYKARQPKLDRFVALKILLRPLEEGKDEVAFGERFAREARALARLNHPNIVAVYDYGEAGGYPFLVMEYVEGLTLRQLLQRGKLVAEEALAIVPKICEALQFAHQKGIVHRDIKPENILLDKTGQVKITDFGIAKVICPGDPDRRLTGAKDVVGTPHYMAPEQIEEPWKVDHRADIYSLGVVFYEMLTGELPLGKFQAPSNKVQLDIRLDEVVLRALAKEPERRYQQASHVKTAVETIATSAGPGNSTTAPTPPTAVAAARPQFGTVIASLFGVTFTSPLALKLANLSVFGSLGFLGFLPVPIPGWQAIFACCGFFGLLGLAFIVESAARRRRKPWGDKTGLGSATAPPLSGPRFSRTVFVGAVWILLFFGLVPPFLAHKGVMHALLTNGLSPLAAAITFTLVLPAALAPLGATILGWIAVVQIRRSAGRLSGLGLAVFDGLLFPLLALDALVIGLPICVWLWLGFGPQIPSREFLSAKLLFLFTVVVSLAITAVTDYFIVRRVWRAVKKPLDDASGAAPASGENQPGPRDALGQSPPLGRWRLRLVSAAILVALLLALGAGFLIWLQRPVPLGRRMTSDSPDGQYQVWASTWRAKRVGGGDRLTYRFDINRRGADFFDQWEIPVPLVKGTVNYQARHWDYYSFQSHGSFRWSSDSKKVAFLVHGIEVSGFNTKDESHSAQEGFLPVRTITLKGRHLRDFFLDLDTGRTPNLPQELVDSTIPVRAGSPLSTWMRINGLDFTRRTNDTALFLVDGISVMMAEKSGPQAEPQAFDLSSTTQVVAAVEAAAQAYASHAGKSNTYRVDARAVYAFQTREGAIGLIEIVEEDKRSGLTRFRFKLVDAVSQKQTHTSPSLPLGLVLERVVNDEPATNSLLDLDTGRFVTIPRPSLLANVTEARNKEAELFARAGADVAGLSPKVSDVSGLMGLDLVSSAVTAGAWDAASVQWVRDAVAGLRPGSITPLSGKGKLPATYVFRTREGGMGLLQILGFTDVPPASGVAVRYKLLQRGESRTNSGLELPNALPAATQPSNHAAGLSNTTQAVVQQQVQMRLSAMKSRLKLTDDQERSVRAVLEKKFALAGELSVSMTEGTVSKEEMEKVDRAIHDLDQQLKGVLTPEQWANYEAWQVEERQTQARLAANVELLQMQPVLQFNQAQRDEVLQILTRLHEQQLAKSYDGLKIPVDWEQQLADIKDALQPVLTPAQASGLRKWLDLQRAIILQTLEDLRK